MIGVSTLTNNEYCDDVFRNDEDGEGEEEEKEHDDDDYDNEDDEDNITDNINKQRLGSTYNIDYP